MDDLSAFFAKKTQKSKDRKKKVNVGDIAKQLERTARIHERTEREEAERQLKEEHQVSHIPKAEDSEWLEDNDDDLTSKLEEIGIKGMDQNGTTTKEDDRAKDIAPVAKTKYVPPVSRRGGNQPKIDINNEEMFPSIDKAAIIEKEIINAEDKNSKNSTRGPWQTQGGNNQPKPAQSTPGAYRPPHRQQNYTGPPSTPQGRVTSNNSTPSSNKYVIPSKRA